jgi:hypothetical protein
MSQHCADVIEILHEIVGAIKPEIGVARELREAALHVRGDEGPPRRHGACRAFDPPLPR